jgi:hypothetical protein
MRNLAVIAGVLLILAATAVASSMLAEGDDFEPLVPCTLAALGFGLFGFGLWVPAVPSQTNECSMDRSDNLDGDGAGDD